MPKTVHIIPYRSQWPAEFQEQAARLRAGLGDLALRIDHIGSTSVPGLDAKDVIDIQISVTEITGEIVEAIQSLGYRQREHVHHDHLPPGEDQDLARWAKLLFKEPVNERSTNLHLRATGNPNQRYPLLFRDYLRSHPATAAAYAELKRRLAANLADPQTYPDVKDPAVDLIYLAAKEWAAASNWQPGDPDA